MPGLKVDLGPGAAETAEPVLNDSGWLSAEEMRQAREMLPPPRLVGAPGRKSFNLRGDSKRLWDEVLKQFGLAVIFDSDYQPTPPGPIPHGECHLD